MPHQVRSPIACAAAPAVLRPMVPFCQVVSWSGTHTVSVGTSSASMTGDTADSGTDETGEPPGMCEEVETPWNGVEPDDAFHGLEGLKFLKTSIVPRIYDAGVLDDAQRVLQDYARKRRGDVKRHE